MEVEISYCQACGHSEERTFKRCPACGSREIRHYTRKGKPRTGYIS